MKYFDAFDLQDRMNEIVLTLGMEHIDLKRVACIRSKGSSTKRTFARCHALGKVMQHGMKTKAHYTIELMHIPKSFGGGFRHHDFVCDRNVEIMHERFMSLRRGE